MIQMGEMREEQWRLWNSGRPADLLVFAQNELRDCIDHLPPSQTVDGAHAGNCALRASAALRALASALADKEQA
jgi:hypothetical protein